MHHEVPSELGLYQETSIIRKWEVLRGIFEISDFISHVDAFQVSSQARTNASSSYSKLDVLMPYSTESSVQVELENFLCSVKNSLGR